MNVSHAPVSNLSAPNEQAERALSALWTRPPGLIGWLCSTNHKDIGRRYVRVVNTVHGRTGSLWEGRFKSSLIDSESYLLTCHRYIECNPVRAGMVSHAAAYRWSSHKGNVGIEDNALLTPHVEYLALGSAYSGLFDIPDDAALIRAIREATNGGYPLVGDALKSELAGGVRRTLERGKPGPRRVPVLTPN